MRRKKRTHIQQQQQSDTPKSIVIPRGASPLPARISSDFRKTLLPNTALNLKTTAKSKHIIHFAKTLDISHLCFFSHSTSNLLNLSIAKLPRGPSLNFNVISYVLAKDVKALQKRPRSCPSDFLHPPILVLSGFASQQSNSVKLMQTMLQNMYPTINLSQNFNVNQARRVVLYSYDQEKDVIEFRHYAITVSTPGISKSVKNLINLKMDPTNDVEESFRIGLCGSESDFEAEESQLPNPFKKTNSASSSTKKQIKLVELGPRLTLKLTKIQQGVNEGEVIYHNFIKKTEQEINDLHERKTKLENERRERREEQERNVKAKNLDKSDENNNGMENLEQDDDLDEEHEMELEEETDGNEDEDMDDEIDDDVSIAD